MNDVAARLERRSTLRTRSSPRTVSQQPIFLPMSDVTLAGELITARDINVEWVQRVGATNNVPDKFLIEFDIKRNK